MESFRKENTESKNSQLWLGWLDLNQRMSVSKTDTLNHLATPHHGTPHRIRTDTLQILNLLPAANWASGALSWPYYYYPILAYLVSNPIHKAMEKYCHTIAVAAAFFLLFEKPSRNPPNPTGFMAARFGFEPKDSSSPSSGFKTGALNQALTSRHNRGMTTLYFGLSYEAVMPAANSQSGDGAPFDSMRISYPVIVANVITYTFRDYSEIG